MVHEAKICLILWVSNYHKARTLQTSGLALIWIGIKWLKSWAFQGFLIVIEANVFDSYHRTSNFTGIVMFKKIIHHCTATFKLMDFWARVRWYVFKLFKNILAVL